MNYNRRKKNGDYTIIAKVLNNNRFEFVKYRNVNDLVKFSEFLDQNFQNWYYFNVFDKFSRSQIGNFTKNKRPYYKRIRQN